MTSERFCYCGTLRGHTPLLPGHSERNRPVESSPSRVPLSHDARFACGPADSDTPSRTEPGAPASAVERVRSMFMMTFRRR